jgi:Ca2+/H+ antiporter
MYAKLVEISIPLISVSNVGSEEVSDSVVSVVVIAVVSGATVAVGSVVSALDEEVSLSDEIVEDSSLSISLKHPVARSRREKQSVANNTH